jgi:ankyrin repeat protein
MATSAKYTHHQQMKPILIPLLLLLAACGQDHPLELEEPALVLAAEAGDLAQVQSLLSRADGKQVNVLDSCRWSPLMKAALNGHLAVVERLLLLGADANLADKGGYQALHLAASRNHLAIAALLLANGAQLDTQERTQGFSPLIWAAKEGHLQMVDYLLMAGANASLQDHQGKTALDWARQMQHQAIVQTLSASAHRKMPDPKVF